MRYIVLVLLNVPIILLALVNFITKYKLGRITKQRLHHQLFLWITLLVVLIASFPVYNIVTGKQPLEASGLSLFDIVQTTAIVLMFYIINSQRQRAEQNEHRLKDLHQELSIRLSLDDK